MVALYMFTLWRLGVLRAFLLARLPLVLFSVIPVIALSLLRKLLTGKGYFVRNPDSHLILTS